MSTNFYFKPTGSRQLIHVGKASMGWVFALRIHPRRGIRTLEDWRARWPDGQIFDEYGAKIPADKLEGRIAAGVGGRHAWCEGAEKADDGKVDLVNIEFC